MATKKLLIDKNKKVLKDTASNSFFVLPEVEDPNAPVTQAQLNEVLQKIPTEIIRSENGFIVIARNGKKIENQEEHIKDFTLDDALSLKSSNAVKNYVIKKAIDANITSINNLETEVSRTNDDISQLNRKVNVLQNATGGEIKNPTNLTSCAHRYENNKSQIILELSTLDTSNVTNMEYMFSGCMSLTSIPALNTTNVTNMRSMFDGCYNLTSIKCYGMKVNFDISAAKLTREALLVVLNNLATVTATTTLKMGATNLAQLTDEDKAIATGKGWTLA
jgi:surface protein